MASSIAISEKQGGIRRIIWNSLSFSAKKIIILSGKEKIATRRMLLFDIISFKSFFMGQLNFMRHKIMATKIQKKTV